MNQYIPPNTPARRDEIRRQFQDHYFRERPLPDCDANSGTFELGLCLAGAVSAGAYTAGVVDFLFEALDAWQQAKDTAAPGTPPHDTVISVITGTSAGGINGAIAAVAAPYLYDPAPAAAPELQSKNGNPFYDAWVTSVDFRYLLGGGDIPDSTPDAPLLSLLDCSALDTTVRRSLSFTGAPVAKPRRWLADPLRIILSVGNLRGVPYQINLRGGTAQLGYPMRIYTDYMRFALSVPGGRKWGRPPDDLVRPDEIALDHAATDRVNWALLGTTALASGAFPLALQPRQLQRRATDYDYRYMLVPAEKPNMPDDIEPLEACFGSELSDDQYRFVCVDGGTFDNEPLEQTRIALAGPLGRNPRDKQQVRRATILIDPFAEAPSPGPDQLPQRNDAKNTAAGFFLNMLMAVANAYKENSRAKPEDLALAQRGDIYSRYLIAPARAGGVPEARGAKAIAAGALGGFLGFLSVHYRHHDYQLGRRNCQHFLRSQLTLPADHALFACWGPALRGSWLDRPVPVFGDDGKPQTIAAYYRTAMNGELPVIPLLGTAADPIPLPPSPRGHGDVAPLEPLIRDRIDRVVDRLMDPGFNWLERTYLWILKRKIKDKAASAALDALREGVKDVDKRF